MKKALSLLLGLALALAAAACGQPSPGQASPAASAAPSGSAAPPAGGEGAKFDLVYACIWPPDFVSPPQSARAELLAEYLAQHPRVNFIDNSITNTEYYPKLATLAVSGDLPDMFMCNAASLPMLIETGSIYPAQKYFENRQAWYQKFSPTSFFDMTDNEGTLWGVPYQEQAYGMLHWNKGIFEECGLDPDKPPQTVEEVIAMAPIIRSHGYVPVAFGCVIPGQYNNSVLNTMLPSYVPAGWVEDKFDHRSPEQTFVGDGGLLRAYQDIYDMGAAGVYNDDICAITENDAYMLFAQGKAAMLGGYGGWASEWLVANCEDAFLDQVDVTYIYKPADSLVPYETLATGCAIGWFTTRADVDNGGEKYEAILDLMEIFTDERYSAAALKHGFTNVPCGFPAGTDFSHLNHLIQKYRKITDEAVKVRDHFAARTIFNGELHTNAGIVTQRLLLGEITPEEGLALLTQYYAESQQ